VDTVGKVLKSANLYQYTFNNPLKYIDPEGEMAAIAGVIVAGYSVAAVLIFDDCMERCTGTKLPEKCTEPRDFGKCANLCIKYSLLLGFGSDPLGSTASTIGGEIGKSRN